MDIYKEYAEKLLELHNDYHELVKIEFEDHSFNPLLYERENKINKKDILYNSKQYETFVRFFPVIPLYINTSGEAFSIEYRSYSGSVGRKLAGKVAKDILDKNKKDKLKKSNGKFWAGKRGLFDFYANTGGRYRKLYGGEATHYNLFEDLYKSTNLNQCFRVWQGNEEISSIAKDENQYEALLTLSLLMFEQEINYGERIYQQFTNFKISNGFRPRDMLMGFINMMFKNKELYDSYDYWTRSSSSVMNKEGIKTSPHFGYDKETQGYANLGKEYKY